MVLLICFPFELRGKMDLRAQSFPFFEIHSAFSRIQLPILNTRTSHTDTDTHTHTKRESIPFDDNGNDGEAAMGEAAQHAGLLAGVCVRVVLASRGAHARHVGASSGETRA